MQLSEKIATNNEKEVVDSFCRFTASVKSNVGSYLSKIAILVL